MNQNAILYEVQQLNKVSNRLDFLAGEHPHVSETLIRISGSVRDSATLLAVLVAVKIEPISPLDPGHA